MSSFSAAAEGAPSLYDGSGTYSPSANEQGVAIQGRANGSGAVGSTVQNVPIPPNLGVVTDIGNILEGVGIGAAGVISIFGSDGALTPVGLSMVASGALQVVSGVGGLTGTFKGGSPAPGLQSGLTPTQEAQLEDAATGSWYDDSLVAEAVWEYDPEGWPASAGGQLGHIYSGVNTMIEIVAWRIPAEVPLFATFQGPAGYGEWVNPPDTSLGAAEPGDTRLTWLARLNPGMTVSQVSSVPGTDLASHGAICIDPGELGQLFWLCWSENEFQAAAFGYNPVGWLDDVYPYLTYTPSSGPPSRLLFNDLSVIMSLLPVKYS